MKECSSQVDIWVWTSGNSVEQKISSTPRVGKISQGKVENGSEKGPRTELFKDREDERGPTRRLRSSKRNITAKGATFIEHYLIMAWCQHLMTRFFMNRLSALHNHTFTYTGKCYYFITKWGAREGHQREQYIKQPRTREPAHQEVGEVNRVKSKEDSEIKNTVGVSSLG